MRSPGSKKSAFEAYLENTSPTDWTFIGYDESKNGSPQQMRLVELTKGRPIALRSSVLELQVAAARLHGCVVMLPDFVAGGFDDLKPVEASLSMAREVWLVVHSRVQDMPVVRAVMDALKLEFEAN
jgi:DNA-binding transcriptional LysR family regulator